MERKSRSVRHWLLGLVGVILVAGFAWASAQSDPTDPEGVYLLRAGFVSGAVGAAGAWLLHRARGWSLTVPRVLGMSALAAALIGPAGASVLGIGGPEMRDVFEWLEYGILAGLGFSLIIYGWRGGRRKVDDE